MYYIYDASKRYKLLIDTGAGISVFKDYVAEDFKQRFSENIVVQGITDQKILIQESTLIPFNINNPCKVYIYNLDIEFDGILGLDFLEHYECIIDLKSNLLKTNFKDIPMHKFNPEQEISESVVCSRIVEPTQSAPNDLPQAIDNFQNAKENKNVITIEPRMEKVYKLNCNLKNTDVILLGQEKDKVRLPNAIVHVDEHGDFLTTVLNPNAIEKTIDFSDLSFELLPDLHSIHSLNNDNYFEPIDRRQLIKEQLRIDHLNEEEREEILKLCLEYSDIFYLEGDQLTFTNEIKHSIDTNNSRPIYTKSYRYPHVHKEEVKRQISKMLEEQIIRPSTSPWSAPVWVVPKKADASGKQKWRVVIDYRKLNEVTDDDKYPLPNISDILDQLGKCEYFSTIDLASGFHQIEIDPKDIPKTAFTVENGHYEFIRMPFGLKNAPATFQRVIESVLLGLLNERCLVYIDDIIVYSATIQEHISRLKEVFKRLRKSNLKIQPDKCEFLRKEVAYLGHLITEKGVKPNPAKVECIQNFPEPKNQKDVKSFLGLAGYYRRFISNFAKISKPLTRLLQKDTPFVFGKECQQAFNDLKEALMSDPILIYPNFEEPFVLTTDASAFAIGAVLSQGPIGKDLPIAYASRTLCSAETKYSTIERELLAIVWAVKHFRPYLFGRQFTLVTDHRPITWLWSIQDPGSRLTRWRLKLEEYSFKIEFKPGKYNKNADALSRIKINYLKECVDFNNKVKIFALEEASTSKYEPDENPESPFNNSEEDQKMTDEYNRFVENYKTRSLIDYSKIEFSNEQLLDKSNKNIVTFFRQNKMEELHFKIIDDIFEEELDFKELKINVATSKSVKNRKYLIIPLPFDNEICSQHLFYCLFKYQEVFELNETYSIENNLNLPSLEMMSFIFADKEIKLKICQNIVTTPDEDQKPIILDHYHLGKNNLHRGINETCRRIREKYYWRGMNKDIEDFIKKCEICQKVKIVRKNLSRPLVITETPRTPFERINIDIFEYPSRNYALTINDELTKFIQAYPLRDKKASTVVDTLMVYFQHYGTPLRIHCDSGKEFDNTLLKDLCQLFDSKITFSSVGHPASNGSLERFHAALGEMTRINQAGNPEDHPFAVLPYAVICYNNTKNKTHGFTPYELIFGHTSNRPPETLYNQEALISKYVRDLNNRMSYFYRLARRRTEDAKQKSKERFDKRVSENLPEFKVGDKVYIKESQIKSKSENKFNGPYVITEILLNSAVLVNPETSKTTKVNFDRIKPYFE